MDNKFIEIEKAVDEKIAQLEGFQEEIQRCIHFLEQMHKRAVCMCETIKNWRNTNE